MNPTAKLILTILSTVVVTALFIFGFEVWKNGPPASPSFAFGYYEKGNVWNRIHIDEKGRVLCAKE